MTQALTRKFLNPTLPNYLHSLFPQSTDKITLALTRLGLDVIFKSLEEVEATDPLIAPPVTVSSSHTKHHLEDLSPNICVFRHPDHLPDRQVLQSSFLSSVKEFNLTAAAASKLSSDALKSLYGSTGDTVLYWAHHEKLCLVDGRTAFMGGLDLCYGKSGARFVSNPHTKHHKTHLGMFTCPVLHCLCCSAAVFSAKEQIHQGASPHTWPMHGY